MTKTKFLTLLQERICMLDDAEQKDILDEYAQHIDMQVESGMTEAEAIEDFGPMDELAAEILSAYHVKSVAVSASSDLEDMAESGKDMASAAVSATKRGCSKLSRILSGAYGKLLAWLRGVKDAVSKFARGLGGATGKAAKGSGKFLASLKDGSLSFGGFCVRACSVLLRWIWNVCVACLAAVSFIVALCSVFGVGLCIILVVQGYPFGGMTVGLLGAALFAGSLGFLMAKGIRVKKAEGGRA